MDAITRRLIAAYFEEGMPTMFLSGFFQSPPQNFHNSEKVEIDIERSGEDVATVIVDLQTGANVNTFDGYTNKEFTPPVFDEGSTLNAFTLMKREPGVNPFVDPDFQANAISRAFKAFRRLEAMVRRAIEEMASQVLQTGTLTLRNKAGVAVYTIDFKPKITHFPTVVTSWATSTTKIADLDSLAKVIRADGLSPPNILVFGDRAFDRFVGDAEVQKRLDNRNMSLGQVAPETRGQGATFQGFVWIGNYRFQMWTYDGRFKHPTTGVSTAYVDQDKVIMLSEGFRGDLTFGAIPRIVPPESRALPFLPGQLSSGERGMSLSTNAWVSPDGTNLHVSAGTRPLVIPTSIDRFGCLKTVP